MKTYKIFKNALASSPNGYHICLEANGMIESEELALRAHGSFRTRKQAQDFVGKLSA